MGPDNVLKQVRGTSLQCLLATFAPPPSIHCKVSETARPSYGQTSKSPPQQYGRMSPSLIKMRCLLWSEGRIHQRKALSEKKNTAVPGGFVTASHLSGADVWMSSAKTNSPKAGSVLHTSFFIFTEAAAAVMSDYSHRRRCAL